MEESTDTITEIREAVVSDAEGIWKLIHELAIFERAENEHVISVEQLSSDLDKKHFHAFVAHEEGQLVGLALFYPIYSTWKGHSYYLEDIIVKEEYRRRGIGRRLFDAVMRFSFNNGGGRLGWQVLDWNEPAIQFYRQYGASFENEWITCRLTRNQLEELTK